MKWCPSLIACQFVLLQDYKDNTRGDLFALLAYGNKNTLLTWNANLRKLRVIPTSVKYKNTKEK